VLTDYAFEINAEGYNKINDQLFFFKDTTLVITLGGVDGINIYKS